MSLIAIRAALEAQLAATLGVFPVAYENHPYTPVPNVAYAAAHLLPARPENPEVGGRFFQRGIFQVTLAYPQGPGSLDAVTKAEAIRAAFPYGASFVSGGVTVNIIQTPEIAPGRAEDDLFLVPVKVRWSAQQGG